MFKNEPYNSVNQFLIYNDLGALVLTKKNVNQIDGLDVSGLKSGIYFAEIDYGTYKEKVKFIKE